MRTPDYIQQILEKHIGSSIKLEKATNVAGGCINSTFRLDTSQGPLFIKVNNTWAQDLFFKEKMGLEILSSNSPIRIPQVIGVGKIGDKAYLLQEWIEKGPQSSNFWIDFGYKLAEQHKITSESFGLDHDNHIGRLDQTNTQHQSWIDFFIHERLQPQIDLAKQKKLLSHELEGQFSQLFEKLVQLMPEEKPALLHGDLWSGNFLCTSEQTPAIFDPAVYYGNRETELAFTTMFGGFDQGFYEAYNEQFPLKSGFQDRIEIHNLYPLLVHVNLFGPSYLSGIQITLNRYI